MTLWHSGWMNASEDGSSSAPAAALHTCYVYAARYSARLLAALAAHHAAGRWGYSELEATELCARGAAVPRCLVARLDVPLSAPAGGVSFGPPWAHGNSGLVTEAELGARRARAQLGATVVFHKVVQ